MKLIIIGLLALLVGSNVSAQYYYKDIVQTSRTCLQMLSYKKQGVSSVKIASFESDGRPTEGFEGSQTIHDQYTRMVTQLQSPVAGNSVLTTFFDAAGRLVRTIDTTDGSSSVSEYLYDAEGRLSRLSNISISTGQSEEKEDHFWHYGGKSEPQYMLRVKNGTDTTRVSFVCDENGNVTEETSRRGGSSLSPVYYYYDGKNQLTDIARYNRKAARLLPEYIFEYDSEGRISSMLVVPEGSDDYQKWYYAYNERGLKTGERCMNKKKQLLGRVEYRYR